ncbi:hypothetical protein ACOSQ2_017117 [Xanthoceras sorbifolium]
MCEVFNFTAQSEQAKGEEDGVKKPNFAARGKRARAGGDEEFLAEEECSDMTRDTSRRKERLTSDPNPNQQGALKDISNQMGRKSYLEANTKRRIDPLKPSKGKGMTTKKGGTENSIQTDFTTNNAEVREELEDAEVLAYLYPDITNVMPLDQYRHIPEDNQAKKVDFDQAQRELGTDFHPLPPPDVSTFLELDAGSFC